MDRRAFLTARKNRLSSTAIHFSVQQVRGIQSGINQYTGAWGKAEVAHLLKRTMFGSKKSDIDYFKSKTMIQTVDELLAVPSSVPAPPVKNYDNTGIVAGDPDTSVPQGQTWVNINTNDGTANNRRTSSLKSWWLGQMLNQQRNVLEKMVLFWHNHFATETNDIGRAIWS